MDKRFSELTAATSVADADIFAISQSGTSKKLAAADLKTYSQTGTVLSSEKGSSLGVASLDASGKIPADQIPDIAITDYLGAAANQAAMLALPGQKGDWCTRTDNGKVYIITGSDPTLIGSWTALTYPASAVVSVDGQTGAVSLSSTYQALDADLTAIAGLTGTSGLLKKTAANTWTLDTTAYTTNTGTVTSVGITAGTGISVSGSPVTGTGSITVTNSAPDQVVALTGSGGTSVSGTYPNFTISSTNTTYATATSTVAGLVELGSDATQTVAANAVSATASCSYAVQLNAAGQMLVNVPWTDTNAGGTVTSVTGTGPISVATGTTTPVISIQLATTIAAGAMSATDKSKLDGIATGATANTGTVTSVGVTVPTGLSVSGTPVTSTGTIAISLTAGYSIPTTSSQTNWDSAYTQRLQWDGGSTNLVASTARTSLGATTVGGNLFTLANPSAVTFPRFNADNTVSALSATSAFNALSPITTNGDLIIGNGANSATRLGIGTNGQVLTSNGSTASWVTPSSGSSGLTLVQALTCNPSGTLSSGIDTVFTIPSSGMYLITFALNPLSSVNRIDAVTVGYGSSTYYAGGYQSDYMYKNGYYVWTTSSTSTSWSISNQDSTYYGATGHMYFVWDSVNQRVSFTALIGCGLPYPYAGLRNSTTSCTLLKSYTVNLKGKISMYKLAE